MVKPKFPPKAQRFHMGEITLGARCGRPHARASLARSCLTASRSRWSASGGHNIVAVGRYRAGGRRRLAGRGRLAGRAIARRPQKFGRLEPGRIVKDRSALDYIRVFVGKASVVGVPLSQLAAAGGLPTHLLHVRRYDADIVPTPDLMLEFGDRVGVLVPPGPQGGDPQAFRRHRQGRRRNSAMSRSGSAWCWASCSGSSRSRSPASAW